MKIKLKISKRAFWDTNIESIDFENQSDYVICRVFERGKWDDVINVINYYGIRKTKNTLMNTEHLSVNAMYLASAIFKTDIKEFRCYTQKQFSPLGGKF
ncbi:MAG: hypothetical protein Q8928_16780 [Bacteroidota bacterium]|nr:hypothetical protein [Bacteroidota bacterium]